MISFIYKCELRSCQRNQILAREGLCADKVYIVQDGEVEVIKTNLNSVYYNEKTAVVGLKEVKKDGSKGKFFKSTDWLIKNETGTVDHVLAYRGTEFEESVQTYLRSFIDTNETFKDKHRSQFNQYAFKEIKVGVFGTGFTFGDIDAIQNRNYMYTLKVVTSGCQIWVIDSETFKSHIEANARLDLFNAWKKVQEKTMINKLANNLFNAFRGMNIDGFNDFDHERFRCMTEQNFNFFQAGRYVSREPATGNNSLKKGGRTVGHTRNNSSVMNSRSTTNRGRQLETDKSARKGVTSMSSGSISRTDILSSEPRSPANKTSDNLTHLLANNPGNFVRQKAMAVDLTEIESIKRQLERDHAE